MMLFSYTKYSKVLNLNFDFTIIHEIVVGRSRVLFFCDSIKSSIMNEKLHLNSLYLLVVWLGNVMVAWLTPPFFPMCDCLYTKMKYAVIVILPILLSFGALYYRRYYSQQQILEDKNPNYSYVITFGLTVMVNIVLNLILFFILL